MQRHLVFTSSSTVPKGSPVFFMSNTKLGEVNISLLPMLHTLRQGIILQYFVEYTMDDSQDVKEKTIFAINSSFTIPFLQEGHSYSFRVAVATSVGKGPYSEWRSIVVNRTKSEFFFVLFFHLQRSASSALSNESNLPKF